MAQYLHTVAYLSGSSPLARQDHLKVGILYGEANAAGGSAGAAVATVVTGFKDLPPNFLVLASMNQDATYFISNPTTTGFTITITPRLAATTLAAGTFGFMIVA